MPLTRWPLISLVSMLAACGAGVDHAAATAQSHEATVAEAAALLENSKCFETEKLSKARNMLNTALAPSSQVQVQARIQLARYHLLSGANCSMKVRGMPLRMAEIELRQALASDPKSAEALTVLGRVLTHGGRYEEALDALTLAERLGGQKPELNINFALTYIATKNWHGAGDYLDRLPICKGPSPSPDCGGKLAAAARIELYTAMKDRSALLRAYQQSVDAFPDSAFMHGNYADHLIRSAGDADAAIAEAEKALAIRAYPKVQRTMALALYAKWAQSLAVDPGVAEQYRQRATSFDAGVEPLMAEIGCDIAGNHTLQVLSKAWNAEGISMDTQDADGNSALIWAASCGTTEDVQWLLEHGSSANLSNAFGATALAIAAHTGRERDADLLIAERAAVNTVDKNGNTPLMNAVAAGHAQIAQKLLQAKADVSKVNLQGKTALMVAVERGDEGLVRLLRDAGADK